MSLQLFCERSAGGHDASHLPPLVCLHGWGMNLRVFDGLRNGLGQICATWAIDLPGHGRSPWQDDRASLDAQLEALLAVLPPSCMLLGWSMGGQFALELAHRAPTRIAALVLIATTPRFQRANDWSPGLDANAVQVFRDMLGQDWRQTLADFVWLQLRGSRNAEALRREFEVALQSHGMPQPQAMAADLELLGVMDQRALLPSIAQPALVITGQNDRVTPPSAGQFLARALARASCVEIPRAGHAPFASHTEECLQSMRPFLQQLWQSQQ